MAGGLMVKSQGRVTLTPMAYSQKLRDERPSTGLGMSGEKKKPRPPSKKANLARVRAGYRAERVLVAQRPELIGSSPSTSLGTGPSMSLGTGPSTSLGTGFGDYLRFGG